MGAQLLSLKAAGIVQNSSASRSPSPPIPFSPPRLPNTLASCSRTRCLSDASPPPFAKLSKPTPALSAAFGIMPGSESAPPVNISMSFAGSKSPCEASIPLSDSEISLMDFSINSGLSRTSFNSGIASAILENIGFDANCSRPCRIFSGSLSTDCIMDAMLLIVSFPSSVLSNVATSSILPLSFSGSDNISATSGFASDSPCSSGFCSIAFFNASGSICSLSFKAASCSCCAASFTPASPTSSIPASAGASCSPSELSPTRRGLSCALAFPARTKIKA
mmetsp:Transcript_70143/g.116511  ORF Transcript_70143/g.116511 Transcript_70143/m.116511 type:complete len:278 (+) Transcript_70143:468-1301(+)